jgi:transposase
VHLDVRLVEVSLRRLTFTVVTEMQLQTILHRLHKSKGFRYAESRFCRAASGEAEIEVEIEVEVLPRKGSLGVCSGCGERTPGYDHLRSRRYEFVPLWNIPVYLRYRPRRVQCPACGVKVERLPWSEGKQTQTTVYVWFLAFWAGLLSWQKVATIYRSSWNTVYRCVQAAVIWGLERRSLDGIASIGVDEIQWSRGHQYLTLVYQIDEGKKRLLHVERERTKESLKGFFRMLGQERSERLEFACSDM